MCCYGLDRAFRYGLSSFRNTRALAGRASLNTSPLYTMWQRFNTVSIPLRAHAKSKTGGNFWGEAGNVYILLAMTRRPNNSPQDA
jgi:hypothetical protein